MFAHLHRLYEILVACDRKPPEKESVWVREMRIAIAQDKAAVWPICAPREALMIGATLFVGDTVHIVIHPDWQNGRWCTRSLRRAYDTWRPSCTVKAPIKLDNSRARRFAAHLGFKPVEEDGDIVIYAKEPYAAPETTG